MNASESEDRQQHAFAIGYYIGSLILVFGVILVLTGLFGPSRPADERLGFDVSLWWGLLMTVSGLFALGLTHVTRR